MPGNTKENRQTCRYKKLLRFPVDYSTLEAMKRALRGKNINNIYRSDLEFDNLHDIVREWIEQFSPDLAYNENEPKVPYLESAGCDTGEWVCYIDLVMRDTENIPGHPYALCSELNGDEWIAVIRFNYLDSINPSMNQLMLMRTMDIQWYDTEEQPDRYPFKNVAGKSMSEREAKNRPFHNTRYMYHRGFHPDPTGRNVIRICGKKITGNWIRGFLWMGNNQAFIIPHHIGVDHDSATNVLKASAYEVIQETVSMLSGLYSDYYSKEIWQDDIVRFKDGKVSFIGKVVFEHGAFGIGTDDHGPLEFSLHNWCGNDNFVSFHELMENQDSPDTDLVNNIRVLGNVWEDNIEDFEDDDMDNKL